MEEKIKALLKKMISERDGEKLSMNHTFADVADRHYAKYRVYDKVCKELEKILNEE